MQLILVVNGAEILRVGPAAVRCALAPATDPGEASSVCEPYYTNYGGYAHMLGIEVVPVLATAREDWFYRKVNESTCCVNSGPERNKCAAAFDPSAQFGPAYPSYTECPTP